MNLSGQPVSSLARYYKVPHENLLVTYDEVDLPLGTLRLRPGGGSAGHKGMASIIERLGTQEFPRLRLGVSRPPGRMEAADYVLQDFSASEKEMLNLALEPAVDAILVFVTEGLEAAMNQFNGAVNQQGRSIKNDGIDNEPTGRSQDAAQAIIIEPAVVRSHPAARGAALAGAAPRGPPAGFERAVYGHPTAGLISDRPGRPCLDLF